MNTMNANLTDSKSALDYMITADPYSMLNASLTMLHHVYKELIKIQNSNADYATVLCDFDINAYSAAFYKNNQLLPTPTPRQSSNTFAYLAPLISELENFLRNPYSVDNKKVEPEEIPILIRIFEGKNLVFEGDQSEFRTAFFDFSFNAYEEVESFCNENGWTVEIEKR